MTADRDAAVDHDLTVLIARVETEPQRADELHAADLTLAALHREQCHQGGE